MVVINYIQEFVEPSYVHESLFVGYLWSNPSLYQKYRTHKITKNTFTAKVWYFYYYLGKEMYENGIREFEDKTVYSFLISRPQEKGKKTIFDTYNDFGGYETISEMMKECVKDNSNDEYHFSEIQKFECLRKYQKEGMIDIQNKELISKLCKMTLKQLQMYFQYRHKEAFAHINSGEVVEHNLVDNLDDVIDRLNKGEAIGIPLHDSPRLSKKIKGWKDGNLIYLVLSSGVGKSSIAMEKFIISLFENNEKGLIFANEENIFKFRVLLLATVCAKELQKPVNREKLTQGNFDKETLAKLHEAKDWLYKYRKDMIKFFELKKYRMEDIINRIELYRPLGYKKVIIDTFKPDLSRTELSRWEAFSQSAQELFDCIKVDNNNAGTLATVQLKIGKEYRYLDLDSIGKSKEIVEVADVVLIGRMIFADEYEGGKHELKPYNWEQDQFTGKWFKKPYKLDPEKQYMVLFIAKNRNGGTDEQIVYEVNYGINNFKEVAYVIVPRTANAFG